MAGTAIFDGGRVAAVANVSGGPAACCELCTTVHRAGCAGWEWINLSLVRASHNCDIMASAGPPAKDEGRVAGIVAPPGPPGPPRPPQPPIIGGTGAWRYQYMPELLALPVGAEVQDAHSMELDAASDPLPLALN